MKPLNCCYFCDKSIKSLRDSTEYFIKFHCYYCSVKYVVYKDNCCYINNAEKIIGQYIVKYFAGGLGETKICMDLDNSVSLTLGLVPRPLIEKRGIIDRWFLMDEDQITKLIKMYELWS